MSRISRWVLLIAAALAAESVALAGGTKVVEDVSIVQGLPNAPLIVVASGSMGSARNNGATAKEIGCKLTLSQWGVWTTCWAHSATAAIPDLQCVTTNPQLATVVSSLHVDSELQFLTFTTPVNQHPDQDFDPGECVNIVVQNSSKFEPKQP